MKIELNIPVEVEIEEPFEIYELEESLPGYKWGITGGLPEGIPTYPFEIQMIRTFTDAGWEERRDFYPDSEYSQYFAYFASYDHAWRALKMIHEQIAIIGIRQILTNAGATSP